MLGRGSNDINAGEDYQVCNVAELIDQGGVSHLYSNIPGSQVELFTQKVSGVCNIDATPHQVFAKYHKQLWYHTPAA